MPVPAAAAATRALVSAGSAYGMPVGVVMHVVKFADARESALEHLDVSLRGHGLDIVGRHARHEAVHERAPAPEVVGRGAAEFGEARHAALEAMTVNVAHPGQRDGDAFVAGLRLRTRPDATETPVRDLDAHVLRPPLGQQRGIQEQRFRHSQM